MSNYGAHAKHHFSCQTTLKKATYLECGIINANLATLITKYCQLCSQVGRRLPSLSNLGTADIKPLSKHRYDRAKPVIHSIKLQIVGILRNILRQSSAPWFVEAHRVRRRGQRGHARDGQRGHPRDGQRGHASPNV